MPAAPTPIASANQNPTSGTSSEVDSVFAADLPDGWSSSEPSSDDTTADQIDHLFEAVEALLPEDSAASVNHFDLDATKRLDDSVVPSETDTENPVVEPTPATNPTHSVADFSWPTAAVMDDATSQVTVQEPSEPRTFPTPNTDLAAHPIRGPPAEISDLNKLVFHDFLNSGPTNAGTTTETAPRQLVVIDPQVDDVSVLAAAASDPNSVLLNLSEDADSLSQIEAALVRSGPFSGIHIFSHGAPDRFTLGNLTIDQELVSTRAQDFARWNPLLAGDATLFLYGCDLAQSEAGRHLVDRLAKLTGAAVAASTDATGNPLVGGDWQLEYRVGQVPDDGGFSVPAYSGLLANPNIINVDNGKLNKAPTVGNDKYNFAADWETITLNKQVPIAPAPAEEATKGGDDIFNFGAVPSNKPLEVTFGKGKETLVVKQGSSTVTADKEFAPNQVDGGKGDDVFTFQHGATITKTLDGGTGTDILNYSDPSKPTKNYVVVNLASINGTSLGSFCATAILDELKDDKDTHAFDCARHITYTSKLTATNIGGGIKSIEIAIGGSNQATFGLDGDVLIADTNKATKLAGARGDDLLIGGDQADLLIGGGKGDAQYIIELRDATAGELSLQSLLNNTTPPTQQVLATLTTLEQVNKGGLLSSIKDDDVLFGNRGNDVLVGGKGNDHLVGGRDNDTLYGGPGDDIYYFENGWGKDRIYDAAGIDTLDFWRVTTPITVTVDTVSATTTNTGTTTTNTGTKDVFTVDNISGGVTNKLYRVEAEKLIGAHLTAPTARDTLLIKSLPKSTMTIGDPDRAGQFHLDLHEIDKDLEVTIDRNDKLASNKVTVQVQGEEDPSLIIYGVSDLTGGKGNNTYKMKNGAEFPGTLIGGAGQQANGKQNILDYSDYYSSSYWQSLLLTVGLADAPKSFVAANLTDVPVTFAATAQVTTPAGQPAAVLPVQEEWKFTANAFRGQLAVGISITGATNPTGDPIAITSTAHGLVTGDKITITGVEGNTAANGAWTVTKVNDDNFTLDGSTGNATYTSGGNWTKLRDISFRATHKDELDEQHFKAKLSGLLGRNDFSVSRDLFLERTITLTGSPTSGSFKLLLKKGATGAAFATIDNVPHNSTADALQTLIHNKLEATAPLRPEDVVVTGTAANWKVALKEITIETPIVVEVLKGTLTGGTNPNVVVGSLPTGQTVWTVTFSAARSENATYESLTRSLTLKASVAASERSPNVNQPQTISLSTVVGNGKLKLAYGEQNTEINNPNANPTTTATAITGFLQGITDVSSSYNVAVVASATNSSVPLTGENLWKVTFTPKNPSQPTSPPRAISATVEIDVNHQRTEEGVKSVNKTFEVYTKATGGHLKLKTTFTDKANEEVTATTEPFHYNASPGQVKAALEDAICKELIKDEEAGWIDWLLSRPPGTSGGCDDLLSQRLAKDKVLHALPRVLASGMGTMDFPWKLTFNNVGNVALSYESATLQLGYFNAVLARPLEVSNLLQQSKIPQNWATGFTIPPDGQTRHIQGITHIVGSGHDDLIFGRSANTAPVITTFTFDAPNASTPPQAGKAQVDTQNIQKMILGGEASLTTGQAVLYQSINPVQELVSGRIYFVEAKHVAGNTEVRFFENTDEVGKISDWLSYVRSADAIELSQPANTSSSHQLLAVVNVQGGKGDDTLIVPALNESTTIRGGPGDDVLAGSNKPDHFEGGKGNDTLYADGSKLGGTGTAYDTLLGGAGEDAIYGHVGPDHLDGGAGEDYLVGGPGSDLVEGKAGKDKIAIIEAGAADDYDILDGGPGKDEYIFDGTWGVASVSGDSSDTINLSAVTDNYVHVLNSGLYSIPGTLHNSTITVEDPGPKTIKLGTVLEDLTGTTSSPGMVVTEYGFAFHQAAEGTNGFITNNIWPDSTNAVLTAFEKPQKPADGYSALDLRLWVDRGSGPVVYDLTLPAMDSDSDIADVIDQLELALVAAVPGVANKTELQDEAGLIVEVKGRFLGLLDRGKLQIIATPDLTLTDGGKIKPAKLELTVKAPNTIVADTDFKQITNIKLGEGANTFVFGNDYWGGDGLLANVGKLFTPHASLLANKLTIDTTRPHQEKSPLVLDFRAVNQELYFKFKSKPTESDPHAVALTVQTLADGRIPVLGSGKIKRSNTLLFTSVDENTKIYGGRYRNNFDFGPGATYEGHLVGGEGGALGGFATFPGKLGDRIRGAFNFAAEAVTGLNLSDVSKIFFQVKNNLSFPIALGPDLLKAANYSPTIVNLEAMRVNAGNITKGTADLAAQAMLGNLLPVTLDKVDKLNSMTGISGIAQNFGDANLGEIHVKYGVNYVRGTDYDPLRETSSANPTAILTSGANTIRVKGAGLHVLAGGSGADTYGFEAFGYWGLALVVDDLFSLDLSVGDDVANAAIDAIIPQDTLDFSTLSKDLYYTIFSLSTDDIAGASGLFNSVFGASFSFPIKAGVSAVVVTPTDPLDGGQDFSFSNLLGSFATCGSCVFAVGVENIKGGLKNNKFNFIDGAEIKGQLSAGPKGKVELDYRSYNTGGNGSQNGVETNLDAGPKFIVPPPLPEALGLPDWLTSMFPRVEYQHGSAEGVGRNTLGVAEAHDVTGTNFNDELRANSRDNKIKGGDGDDLIVGEAGKDQLWGEAGNDELRGGPGTDGLYGDGGNDTLHGGDGDDDIQGGPGNDVLNGDGGDDILYAGDGDDTIDGGAEKPTRTGSG